MQHEEHGLIAENAFDIERWCHVVGVFMSVNVLRSSALALADEVLQEVSHSLSALVCVILGVNSNKAQMPIEVVDTVDAASCLLRLALLILPHITATSTVASTATATTATTATATATAIVTAATATTTATATAAENNVSTRLCVDNSSDNDGEEDEKVHAVSVCVLQQLFRSVHLLLHSTECAALSRITLSICATAIVGIASKVSASSDTHTDTNTTPSKLVTESDIVSDAVGVRAVIQMCCETSTTKSRTTTITTAATATATATATPTVVHDTEVVKCLPQGSRVAVCAALLQSLPLHTLMTPIKIINSHNNSNNNNNNNSNTNNGACDVTDDTDVRDVLWYVLLRCSVSGCVSERVAVQLLGRQALYHWLTRSLQITQHLLLQQQQQQQQQQLQEKQLQLLSECMREVTSVILSGWLPPLSSPQMTLKSFRLLLELRHLLLLKKTDIDIGDECCNGVCYCYYYYCCCCCCNLC